MEYPLSPFFKEKLELGLGFLAPTPFEALRGRRGTPRPHLSDADKEYIGSTGREVSVRELAERFDIGEAYVHKLRDQHRYPNRARDRR